MSSYHFSTTDVLFLTVPFLLLKVTLLEAYLQAWRVSRRCWQHQGCHQRGTLLGLDLHGQPPSCWCSIGQRSSTASPCSFFIEVHRQSMHALPSSQNFYILQSHTSTTFSYYGDDDRGQLSLNMLKHFLLQIYFLCVCLMWSLICCSGPLFLVIYYAVCAAKRERVG